MAIPGLGAAATSDKGKRFLAGVIDTMTGGQTDFDQKGDNRIQEFQKNQLDRNIRAAQGFADFATGGLTDFDKKGDSRLQQFQKNQMRRNLEGVKSFGDFMTGGLTDFDQKGDSGLQQFGKKATGVVEKAVLGGAGTLAQNAMNLMGINGTQRMDTGEVSQGAQELAQKVEQNEKTSLMQKVAGFLERQNPYQELMRDTSVVDPNTGKRINKDLLDLLNNRPDLRKRMDETGSIFSDI
tara:strand:- start:74 stop:787 length:714 start_codon:yes stop_codon:yes gene_type:complete